MFQSTLSLFLAWLLCFKLWVWNWDSPSLVFPFLAYVRKLTHFMINYESCYLDFTISGLRVVILLWTQVYVVEIFEGMWGFWHLVYHTESSLEAMDSEKAMASGVTVIGPGAPSTYHVAPRMENPEFGTSQMTPPVMVAGSERKKRGRPRKYKPDESSSRVFSSVQVSSSAPPAAGKAYGEDVKPRATTSEKKHKSKIGTEKLGIKFVFCFLCQQGFG